MSRLSVPTLILVLLYILNQASCATLKRPKVILVSMDGFRNDYLSKTKLPNFEKMIKSGVKMPYVNNTYVTLTFPCHYTIVTGRYEESHGIISNHMYDPVYDSYFSMKTVEPRWWNGAEPIWITAKKAKLKAGVFFWPGSGAPIQGMYANEWRPYDGKVPYEERVNTVIKWVSEDDFDLGLLYFDEPDHTGHSYGPDSQEIIDKLKDMDVILGLLLEKIEQAGLKNVVNLIVTSDHGMENVNTLTKLIDLTDHVNSSLLLDIVQDGVTAHIRPQPGKAEELVQALSNVPNMKVMLKDDIPEHYHYKNHRRVMPVYARADEGWQITRNATSRKQRPFLGDHGYDNDLLTMKPIFIANGPAFKSGEEVEPMKSVDIYPLICHLLGIEPAPNNGSLQRASALLRVTRDSSPDNVPSLKYCAVLIYMLLLITLVV